jgi:hypothetical protein
METKSVKIETSENFRKKEERKEIFRIPPNGRGFRAFREEKPA